MKRLLTFCAALLLSAGPSALPAKAIDSAASDWSLLLRMIGDTGPAICTLKFPTYETGPSLRLENRFDETQTANKGRAKHGAAILIVGNVDGLLSKTIARVGGVQVKLGRAWTSGEIVGSWRSGAGPVTGSWLTLPIAEDVDEVLPYLASSTQALIVVPTDAEPRLLQFEYASAARAVAAFERCVVN